MIRGIAPVPAYSKAPDWTTRATRSRHKAIIGPKPRARSLSAQQGEAVVAIEALNRMIRTAKPVSARVA